MELPISASLTENPELLALHVRTSGKISGPLVHAVGIAKEHFCINWFSEGKEPYLCFQDPEGIYHLNLNINLDEAHARFACALGIGWLFIGPPRCAPDELTAENRKKMWEKDYRFALAFTISESGLAEDCAGREITPDFRTSLADRYGVPQAIMDNCLVVRGYIERENAPPLEGYFAELIPREFRA